MSDHVIPFRIDIPGADLDDLRARLRRTRWPGRETVDDWSQGIPLAYARALCEYGLDDSPAGLCAWIVEKFWAWTDEVRACFRALR
jgi:Epoxide hydrolase N terminus